jgi:hypothetical protein
MWACVAICGTIMMGFVVLFDFTLIDGATWGVNPDAPRAVLARRRPGRLCAPGTRPSEEVLFRGYILENARDQWNVRAAIVVSSLVFAAMHAANAAFGLMPLINLVLFGVAMALCKIYVEDNQLWGVFAIHAVWNWLEQVVFWTPEPRHRTGARHDAVHGDAESLAAGRHLGRRLRTRGDARHDDGARGNDRRVRVPRTMGAPPRPSLGGQGTATLTGRRTALALRSERPSPLDGLLRTRNAALRASAKMDQAEAAVPQPSPEPEPPASRPLSSEAALGSKPGEQGQSQADLHGRRWMGLYGALEVGIAGSNPARVTRTARYSRRNVTGRRWSCAAGR